VAKDCSAEFKSCGTYDCIVSVGAVAPDTYIDVYRKYYIQHRNAERLFILNDIRKLTSVLGAEGYRKMGELADEYNIGHVYLATVSHDRGRPIHGKMVVAVLSLFKVGITPRYFNIKEDAVSWLIERYEDT